jgi:hypothetical protein
MKTIKAILIDPFACTVSEVEHDASEISGIYDLISHESMRRIGGGTRSGAA